MKTGPILRAAAYSGSFDDLNPIVSLKNGYADTGQSGVSLAVSES